MPPILGMWWEVSTPLAGDCEIALHILHCTPGEFYRRTTWKERLLMRLHLAYRAEQRDEAETRQQQKQERDAAMRQQLQQHRQGRA